MNIATQYPYETKSQLLLVAVIDKSIEENYCAIYYKGNIC